MPVYNAGAYVVEAIESILNQTYKNIEFIIVDDGSTDGSYDIAKSYAEKDKRITLLRNKKNCGVSVTVKKALSSVKSTSTYIARMDADDIAVPKRLEKQVEYLKSHPKTVAVGGQCVLIDSRGFTIGQKTFPTKFEDIYKYIFEFVPVQQPTLMIAAKRLPEDFQFYRDGMNTAEEVELIFKLFMHGKVENLSDTLLLYRVHGKNTSFKNIKETFFLTILSRMRGIFSHGYKPTVKGVFITLAQTVTVLLLPEKVTFFLYRIIKKLDSPTFSPRLKGGLSLKISKAL